MSNAGYKYLDVRPAIEVEDVGKIAGSVNVPVANGKKRFSAEKKKKVTALLPLHKKYLETKSAVVRGSCCFPSHSLHSCCSPIDAPGVELAAGKSNACFRHVVDHCTLVEASLEKP